MRLETLAMAIVLALVAVAVWLMSAPRGSAPATQQPPQTTTSSPLSVQEPQQTNTTALQPPTAVEVTWRGYIYARVVDFVNMTGGYTEWFFGFGNGTKVRLDFTNATFRLRDHFIEYYRGGDRPVYVRGVWNGTVLKALEIYD
jgi:hypothetical protein